MTETKKISDLIPDDKNANKGTERGRKAVAQSLGEDGAGRSILIDRNGKVIAGNKTLEQAGVRIIALIPIAPVPLLRYVIRTVATIDKLRALRMIARTLGA